MSRDEYRRYLRTPHWRRVRQAYFEAHPKVCFVCDREYNIHLHHRTYANLQCEQDADLVPLCKRCHTLLHKDKHWHGDSHVTLRQRFLRDGEKALTPKARRRRGKRTAPRVDLVTIKGYYACPACGALPGEKCRSPRGSKRKRLHQERIDYALAHRSSRT